MKKIFTVMTAAALILAVDSCSGKKAEPAPAPVTEVSAPLLSYKTANITMTDDFRDIVSMDKRVETVLIFGILKKGGYCGYLTNPKFTESTSFEFTPAEGEIVKGASIIGLGKTAVMTTLDGNIMIYVFQRDGTLESTFNCGDFANTEHFLYLYASEDGFYVMAGAGFNELYYVNSSGEYVGSIGTGSKNVMSIANDPDGKPVLYMSDNDHLYSAHLSGSQLADETDLGERGNNIRGWGAGYGDITSSAVFNDGLYIIENGTWSKLTDFSDNDFGPSDVIFSAMTAENEFVLVIRNNQGNTEMRLLTERDISEIKAKKTLKLSYAVGRGSDILDDRIKKFNAENDEYKVEIVNYGDMDSFDSHDWYDALRLDIISGNAPDIINFTSSMPLHSFGSAESIFVDLYDMIDKDTELSRDDFLDGFLEGYETNGKLLMFNTKFSINTIAIKDKFLNGMTTWNIDQLEEVYRNMPDDMYFSTSAASETKPYVFFNFVNIGKFMDYKNASCSFDSPEFIRYMKLIGENDIGIKTSEYDYDSRPYVGNYYAEIHRTDKALAYDEDAIEGFYGFKLIEQGYMAEPTTFIGYPVESGCGSYRTASYGYGIMANSDNIDGAWEFLKYYLLDDDSDPRFYFSGLKDKFNEQAEAAAQPHVEIDPNTGEEYVGETYSWFDNGGVYNEGEPSPQVHHVDILPLTEEQKEKYKALTLDAMRNVYCYDSNVYDILLDELDYYFEGERSAEDTAKIIQNRVSLYVSEQYT